MKGWLRLVVVVSALFIVVIHGFVAYEYTEVKEKLAVSQESINAYGKGQGDIFDKMAAAAFDTSKYEIVGQEGTFIRCSIESPSITCSVKKKSYFLALLVPLAVLWFVLPGLVWAFRWVRAGFKDAA